MDYWRIRNIPFISWRNLLRSNSRPSKNAWIYQRRVKKKMNCLLVGPVQVLYVFVINRFKWELGYQYENTDWAITSWIHQVRVKWNWGKSTKEQSMWTWKEHLQQNFYWRGQQVLGSLIAIFCRMWKHNAAMNVNQVKSIHEGVKYWLRLWGDNKTGIGK